MVDDTNSSEGDGAGIPWEPGEEDYPFPALPGEQAMQYLRRWLDSAGFARIERDGVVYVHETDLVNVVNHITADVRLLRARLSQFGDRIIAADQYDPAIAQIETAVADITAALAGLAEDVDGHSGGSG